MTLKNGVIAIKKMWYFSRILPAFLGGVWGVIFSYLIALLAYIYIAFSINLFADALFSLCDLCHDPITKRHPPLLWRWCWIHAGHKRPVGNSIDDVLRKTKNRYEFKKRSHMRIERHKGYPWRQLAVAPAPQLRLTRGLSLSRCYHLRIPLNRHQYDLYYCDAILRRSYKKLPSLMQTTNMLHV